MIGKSKFAILLTLEEDPLLPLKTVAERANLSWPTVKKKYMELKESKILRNPTATYTPEVLDLQRVSVFADVSNLKNLLTAELACNEHPYTSYRVRTLKGSFGLYIQFNIPKGTSSHIRLFMDNLVDMGTITNYQLYTSTGRRREFYPVLNRFNTDTMEWDFSWGSWIEGFSETKRVDILPKVRLHEFHKIKKVHLDILRLLTKDASKKQKEISEELGLKRSTMNDHYRFVMNNMVSSIRLHYDRRRFNLSETYLLHIHNSERIDDFVSHTVTNPPPFRLSIDLLSDGSATMWANMSRKQFKEFTYSIWSEFPETEFLQLDTTDEGAARYWFYPANFDFEKHWWRNSEVYMVDDPINRMRRKVEVWNTEL